MKLIDKDALVAEIEKRIKESESIIASTGKDIITLSGSMFMLIQPEVIYLSSGNYEEYMKFNSQYLINIKGGIAEFVRYINKNKTALHEKVIYGEHLRDGVVVELALQYSDSYNENIHTFANNINTQEGGTHLSGFRAALTRVINE